MKNLKTKIGLSVLALACLGAGTLTLQNNVFAKAEDEGEKAPQNRILMAEGADICLSEEFSGIRWKTTIAKGYPADVKEGTVTQFGVLVAPTGTYGDYLTFADVDGAAGAVDLAFFPGAIDTTAKTSFYSVIDYNKITENFGAAAKLELTARAYVKYTDTDDNEREIYADLKDIDTSRSARAIAINAEINGVLDEYRTSGKQDEADNAVKYYGRTPENYVTFRKGASDFTVDAQVINKDTLYATEPVSATVEVGTVSELDEVLFGMTKVDATLNGANLVFDELDEVKEGEYYVATFAANGDIVVKPVIYATKVLTKADDLEMFQAKGDRYVDTSKIDLWAEGEDHSSQVFPGYYVLGNNIDATYYQDKKDAEGKAVPYYHGSRNSTTLRTTKTETVKETNKTGDLNGDGKIEGKVEVTSEGTYAELHGTFNNGTYNTVSKYKNKLGLTGTFNGRGYSIQNLVIASQREGMFGLVYGGTVKNVGFLNVKTGRNVLNNGNNYGHRFVLANFMMGATIDNIHITMNAYNSSDAASPGWDIADSAALAAYAADDSKISNVFVQSYKTPTGSSNVKGVSGGQLFSQASENDCTIDNVALMIKPDDKGNYYPIIRPYPYTQAEDGSYVQGGDYVQITLPASLEHAKIKDGTFIKGKIYLCENQFDAEGNVSDSKYPEIAGYEYRKLKGVFFTSSEENLAQCFTDNQLDMDAFFNTGCWTLVDGIPVWAK